MEAKLAKRQASRFQEGIQEGSLRKESTRTCSTLKTEDIFANESGNYL